MSTFALSLARSLALRSIGHRLTSRRVARRGSVEHAACGAMRSLALSLAPCSNTRPLTFLSRRPTGRPRGSAEHTASTKQAMSPRSRSHIAHRLNILGLFCRAAVSNVAPSLLCYACPPRGNSEHTRLVWSNELFALARTTVKYSASSTERPSRTSRRCVALAAWLC